MKIAIGNDHAGPELKFDIINRFKEHEFINFGCDTSESVDYPDFAHPVAEAILAGKTDIGILICGSGNGINMSANKHQGIRSALCWEPEIASLARQHNNANILAIPARFVSVEKAEKIVEAFLSAQFEGGRHQKRIDKIACI